MLYPEIQNSGSGAVLPDISGHIIVLRKVLATQQSQLGKTLRIILDNRNEVVYAQRKCGLIFK